MPQVQQMELNMRFCSGPKFDIHGLGDQGLDESNLDPDVGQERLLALARRVAAEVVHRLSESWVAPEDVASGVLVRWFETLRRGDRPRNVEAFMRFCARCELIDQLRERGRSGVMATWQESEDSRVGNPETHACIREIEAALEALIASRAQPYREILHLRLQRGWSISEVAAWLQAWRPIGRDEATRLIKLSRCIPVFDRYGDLAAWSTAAPRRVDGKKNRWSSTPRPPFVRHLV